MQLTLKNGRTSKGIIILIYGLYLSLFLYSKDFSFFWDSIAQISKEGFNYFKLLEPEFNELSISHSPSPFPLMGLTTAFLWKIFGLHLWVTHLFVFLWSVLLIYNAHKVVQLFLPKKYAAIVTFIALTEPTILSQLAIGGIDIIIFSTFVISLRAILEHKRWLLAFGIFFLINIYSRGLFIGAIFLIVDFYFNLFKTQKKELKTFVKFILPYIPAFIFLSVSLYIYLESENKVLLTSSSYSNHYLLPENMIMVIKHAFEFGLRTFENGRFFIWLLAFIAGYKLLKTKHIFSTNQQILLSVLSLHFLLYFLFIFISQIPFSARYFMPHFFLLTIFCSWYVIEFFKKRTAHILISTVILFQASGHFWIYPDNIAKSWDCTLSHIPYYSLREECFNFIDDNGIDYNDVSAGFCFYGDRGSAELDNFGKRVHGDKWNRKFFIYSNISADDSDIKTLQNSNEWRKVKGWKKGFVFVSLMEKTE